MNNGLDTDDVHLAQKKNGLKQLLVAGCKIYGGGKGYAKPSENTDWWGRNGNGSDKNSEFSKTWLTAKTNLYIGHRTSWSKKLNRKSHVEET